MLQSDRDLARSFVQAACRVHIASTADLSPGALPPVALPALPRCPLLPLHHRGCPLALPIAAAAARSQLCLFQPVPVGPKSF